LRARGCGARISGARWFEGYVGGGSGSSNRGQYTCVFGGMARAGTALGRGSVVVFIRERYVSRGHEVHVGKRGIEGVQHTVERYGDVGQG